MTHFASPVVPLDAPGSDDGDGIAEVYPIPADYIQGLGERRKLFGGVWSGAPAENDVWTFYSQFCAILIVF